MRVARGASLIEVLVSIAILSFILLGWDAMQVSALKAAKATYYFNFAAAQLHSLTERIKAMEGFDDSMLAIWHDQNQRLLPQCQTQLIREYPNAIATIAWGGMRLDACKQNKISESGCLRLIIKLEK